MSRPLLVLLPALLAAAAHAGARIDGRVVDASGGAVPGAEVTATAADGTSRGTLTGDDGSFRLDALPAGTWRLEAVAAGYEPVVRTGLELADGATLEVLLLVEVAELRRSVEVEGAATARAANDPHAPGDERLRRLSLLPLERDRFLDALPLLPGVVRGPDGRLNFQGARASQSALLVNGSSATDPLTGDFAVELPLKAVEAVEVYAVPSSAEHGATNAAVVDVVTRAGGDEWDVDLGGLFPSIGVRDGVVQIQSATPRLRLSGPLRKGRAWLAQGVSYRFVRSRVYDLELPGDDEQVLESFDSLTQLDVDLGGGSGLTATLSYFPVETDNFGLSTLQPESATPDFSSHGWNAAVEGRVALGHDLLWRTSVAVNRYDVAVEPQGQGRSELVPSGLRDNYFNHLDRESRRLEVASSLTRSLAGRSGEHLVKAGVQLSRVAFDGIDRSGAIDLVDAGGVRFRAIDFAGAGRLAASDLRLSLYLQDRWRPRPDLGLDLGLRLDRDGATSSVDLGPRLALAWSPWPGGATVLRAGAGLFHDRLPLHALSFEDFQARRETDLATGRETAFANRVAAQGLDVPHTVAWNVEVDRAFGDDWLLRVAYRQRRVTGELRLERRPDDPAGAALLLAAEGGSSSRELDLTLAWTPRPGSKLFFSYARSRATGELNDFRSLYGDRRSPLVLAAEQSRLPFDVPHRFLAWGVVELPWRLRAVTGIEWRSGFPYTVFTGDWQPIGARNRAGRFPAFLSADLEVSRPVRLFRRQLRLGVKLYNLTGHFNPRDVETNRASPDFLEFRNSPGVGTGLRFDIGTSID